jgi:hypothetical protein
LQIVQKLEHIPETWFVILKKNKTKLSLWINLWRPSLVLLLKWLDVWMWLHILKSFCFCYLVMLISLGTLQIIELMISFLQAPFKELYFCFVWSVVQTLEDNCISVFCDPCKLLRDFVISVWWSASSSCTLIDHQCHFSSRISIGFCNFFFFCACFVWFCFFILHTKVYEIIFSQFGNFNRVL